MVPSQRRAGQTEGRGGGSFRGGLWRGLLEGLSFANRSLAGGTWMELWTAGAIMRVFAFRATADGRHPPPSRASSSGAVRFAGQPNWRALGGTGGSGFCPLEVVSSLSWSLSSRARCRWELSSGSGRTRRHQEVVFQIISVKIVGVGSSVTTKLLYFTIECIKK